MLRSISARNPKISLDRFYRRFASMLLLQAALEFSVWISGILCVTILAAYFSYGELSRVLLIVASVACGISVAALLHLDVKRKANLSLLCVSLEKQSDRFSDLFSAWQLSSRLPEEGVSEEMKAILFQTVQQKLDEENPGRWIRARSSKFYLAKLLTLWLVLIGILFCPPYIGIQGLKRLCFGDQREFNKFVKVEPQGGRIIAGEDGVIRAELLGESYPYPRLQVESSGRWQEIPAESSGKISTYKIKSVLEKVRYKIQWKSLEGGPYTLVPIDLPYLTDFKITLIHPSYTELPDETVQGEPQLSVLRGTKIILNAVATKPLKKIEMVSNNGIQYSVEVSKGRNLSVHFSVLNPFDFHFDLLDQDGIRPSSPVQYHVSIREDRYPEVRLLAPSDDLEAGRESKIPFTFEMKDDMGASSVFLNIKEPGYSKPRKILLRKYNPPILEKIDESELNLASLGVSPGTVLKVQLEVQDNDTVTGPKSGFSETIALEVQSYEANHQKVEGALKDFRKDLLSVLADQTLNRTPDPDWKSLAENPGELDKKMKESGAKQTQTASKMDAVRKKLSDILEDMSRDPLTGHEIFAEHQAIKDALSSILSGPMDRASKEFNQGDWAKGAAEQDQAISELERISDISEQVMKHNKMNDLVHSADRLEEKGRALEGSLAGAKAMDPKLAQELRETLKEAMDILSEIQKQVKDLPEELPEDFVNKAAMKDLDMGEMVRSASELNRALQSGDVKAALEAARNLLKKVKAARAAISKSANDTPMTGKGDLAEPLQEKSNAIDSIVEQQENLLRKTLALEAQRKEAALEAQKKTLFGLAQRQKSVLQKTETLSREIVKKSGPETLKSISLNALGLAEPKMQSVLKEFESANVIFSQKWLKEIVENLGGAEPGLQSYVLSQSSTTVGLEVNSVYADWKKALDELSGIKNEEQDVLNLLKDSSALNAQKFSQQELTDLKSMADEQKKISDETKKLKTDLAQMSARSAQIKPEIMESLKNAGAEMQSSEGALKNANTPEATGSQERALSHLRKGRDGLQSAQGELSKMKQNGGGKPNLIQPRNQSGGQAGSKSGPVKIPGAADYLPPKEFREEILESLKEKYPQAEEEMIKQYYKKITQ